MSDSVNLVTEMNIHELHISDYYEIYSLWQRTPGMGLSDADSKDNIEEFLIRNKGMSFYYKEKNEIVGTILCGYDGRRGYIYHVTVAEEYREKGIGRMLVEKSLESLRKAGIRKCHLFVFTDNQIGNSFWGYSGWTKRDDIFVYSKNI
jgi:ribosomal protein S18 acetylase RimI-like enzyme